MHTLSLTAFTLYLTLAGSLLAAPGDPAATDVTVQAQLLSGDGQKFHGLLRAAVGPADGETWRLVRTRTPLDVDGQLKLTLTPDDQKALGDDSWIHISADDGQPRKLRAAVALNSKRVDRVIDLGEIKLARQVEVVSGTIRDPSGAPRPGARVAIVEDWGDRMALAAGVVVTSDASGKFSIVPTPDAFRLFTADGKRNDDAAKGKQPRLLLVSEHAPHVPAVLDLGVTPRTEFELALTTGSEVSGKVTVAAGVDATKSLAITLAYEAPSITARFLATRGVVAQGPSRARFGIDGSFQWGMLPPGKVSVRVAHALTNAVLFQLEGFELPGQASALSASLAAIDLRAKLTN